MVVLNEKVVGINLILAKGRVQKDEFKGRFQIRRIRDFPSNQWNKTEDELGAIPHKARCCFCFLVAVEICALAFFWIPLPGVTMRRTGCPVVEVSQLNP